MWPYNGCRPKKNFAVNKKNMYLLIIFLPLIGSIAAGLFGNKIGPYGSVRITTFCIFITCIFSYF